MADHALLSASGATRWVSCPASIPTTKDMPDTSGAAACYGTAGHNLGERALLDGDHPTEYMGMTFPGKDKDWEVDEEMAEAVGHYTDYIRNLEKEVNGFLWSGVELQLDFSRWVPEGFGTSDFTCLYMEDGELILHIVDLKMGVGVEVDAHENYQGLLYALGALEATQWMFDEDIAKVRISIAQTRIRKQPSEYEVSVDELVNKWGEFFKEKALIALSDNPPFNPGSQCTFCRARKTCRARAEYALSLAKLEFDEAIDIDVKDAKTLKEDFVLPSPSTLTNEEIARLYPLMPILIKWAEDVKKHGLKLAMNGDKLPNLKLVAGRSTRSFTDEQEVENILLDDLKLTHDDLYEEKMLTLAKLEKLVGKKTFNEYLGSYVEKSTGAPTLVLASDKRPEVTPQGSVDADFDEDLDDE